MRKISMMWTVFAVAIALTACGTGPKPAAVTTAAQERTAADTDSEDSDSDELNGGTEIEGDGEGEKPGPGAGMKVMGTEDKGYVTVPEMWVEFQDLDGGGSYQCSNVTHTSIITLDIFSLGDLSEQEKQEVSTQDAANSVWYNLEQSQVTDISGARVTLGGYEAYQLNGSFTSDDYSLPSTIVCWIFEDGDKVIRYVSAEASNEDIGEVVSYVEGSFDLDGMGE